MRKWKFEEVKEYINSNNCKLLSLQYLGCDTLLDIQCSCTTIFQATFRKFRDRNKRQCNDCGNKIRATKKTLSFDHVRNYIEVESQSGCKLISTKYTKKKDKLELVCKCGKHFMIAFDAFCNKNRFQCPDCGRERAYNKYRKTTQQFKQEVYGLVKDEYEILDEYINQKTKILFKHITCDKTFYMSPNKFLSDNNRCPHCNASKGERRIREILDSLGFKYKEQYRIKECKNIKPLPFDFAVLNQNETLKCLIEFDGKQHYEKWKKFGENKAMELLNKTKHRDMIKTEFCKNNNIQLIRIPYWDFDKIEEILNKFIKSNYNYVGGNT